MKNTAFDGRYLAVPRWAIGVVVLSVAAFCVYVFVQLGTWGECPIPEIRQSCAVWAFPIFRRYEDDADFGCRSCACNTLIYVNGNCTAVTAASSHAKRDRLARMRSAGCHADVSGNQSRYASNVLNASPAILQAAASIFIAFCPSDTDLLDTLSLRAAQPVIMILEEAQRRGNRSVAVDGNASAEVSARTINWTFPPGFGFQNERAADGPWPLTMLSIRGAHIHARKDATGVRLTNMPLALWKLKALRSLHINGMSLSQIPSSVRLLTMLRDLSFQGNLIASVPSSIGHLTGLLELHLARNLISAVPPFIGKLTGLQKLYLENSLISSVPSAIGQLTVLQELNLGSNLISSVPPSIRELTGLQHLHLHDNSISSVPPFIGKLTALQWLGLQNNLISSVPSSIGQLTGLKVLNLQNNSLSAVPASIMGASRSSSSSFRLDLEANNISLAAMSAALAAIPSSAGTAGTNPPAALALVGRNPACNEGAGSSLASRVGPWRIKCEPECAAGCRETGVGDAGVVENWVESTSWVGNGFCNSECDTLACGWDGGDCE